ncbi:hypothetical protein SeLEV6574_g01398 [Synchytrium endobioticum]|uniref:Ubiquitin-activating enzyme E1-like n=1 Tax=Synchytrium endobioticum TaxID=286115 RepID=A0A507DD86_9FUNG|nr:hypothetical protein SeLEV6574_g01398 [Synchytrium endobioticum]
MTSHPVQGHLEAALGGCDELKKIQSSRVLMVGAGGIGCELLKNLVLSGFENIQVVDLDTIDLSNLNRQFLFQKQHISKSKAHVARESALRFNPHVSIKAHHASIMDPQFDLNWFRSFDLVLNALDNKNARSYVNMMCQAADRILIESGSTGDQGQTSVHIKGQTQCWDCETHPTQKTFPVCTIRSTPSEPIHCIVWAKSYLFTQLFGRDEMEETIDTTENTENSQEIENLKKEAMALKVLKASAGSPDWAERVFKKVFTQDINRLLGMEDMWKNRKPPVPLVYENIGAVENKRSCAPKAGLGRDQKAWTLEENVAVFMDSLDRLAAKCINGQKNDPEYTLPFDKDDDDALDFVTATANLRALGYGIGTHSRFKVKEMAGNIIPAVATINSVVAGMIVLRAFQVLTGIGNLKRNTETGFSYSGNVYLKPTSALPPNPYCDVCSWAYFVLRCNPANLTVGTLLGNVIHRRLGLKGDIEIRNADTRAGLYDADFDDNLDASLKSFGLGNGKKLAITCDVEDEAGEGDYQIRLYMFIEEKEFDEADGFEVDGDLKTLVRHHRRSATLVEPAEAPFASESKHMKRKTDDHETVEDSKGKKPRTAADVSTDIQKQVVIIDEDDPDIIVLE